MLLLPLCCVFIRIGRRRATPREILSTGTDRRDVRRAETAWRREYADRAPPVGETTAALRALGAVRDGDRVASLLRWCDARGASSSRGRVAGERERGDGGRRRVGLSLIHI